ncbi:hypothetical protein [Parasphingopyxis lamellibrachiae]|uniref:Uncharacterized protein n=1 Tax=Parasphingopyxis lamellibrachiae TaxID=680125 RepID=A0A3D9FIN6_9SPHN|nr:hypothetical protein [Parasphingopyxis lamellibrachiae]RED17645.1 hypothetical protein DFR46_2696 [Parasphingopyxis lamellibrachiae]
MGQQIFDGNGRKIGSVKSDQEVFDQQLAALMIVGAGLALYALAMAVAAVLAAISAPFLPIFLAAYMMLDILNNAGGWYGIFAEPVGVCVVALGFWALWSSRSFRIVYLGTEWAVVVFFAFSWAKGDGNYVVGSVVAALTVLVGVMLLTYIDSRAEPAKAKISAWVKHWKDTIVGANASLWKWLKNAP